MRLRSNSMRRPHSASFPTLREYRAAPMRDRLRHRRNCPPHRRRCARRDRKCGSGSPWPPDPVRYRASGRSSRRDRQSRPRRYRCGSACCRAFRPDRAKAYPPRSASRLRRNRRWRAPGRDRSSAFRRRCADWRSAAHRSRSSCIRATATACRPASTGHRPACAGPSPRHWESVRPARPRPKSRARRSRLAQLPYWEWRLRNLLRHIDPCAGGKPYRRCSRVPCVRSSAGYSDHRWRYCPKSAAAHRRPARLPRAKPTRSARPARRAIRRAGPAAWFPHRCA